MTRPLYAAASALAKPTTEHWHKGLWYERFVDIYQVNGSEWRIPKPNENGAGRSKNDWIETVTGKTGNDAELKRHASALLQRTQSLGGVTGGFKSDWHFATGLGNPHPVENGFLWHPTLGVPYLPGSSVKGLVRAWVEHWDDSLSAEDKQARCQTWFGTEAKKDVPEHTGQLIFFDALPTSPVMLAQDVMTPHYGKWYEQGADVTNLAREPQKIPADWHDPVPVPFLVVKSASWLFAIAPRSPAHAEDAQQAMQALQQALAWLGAGAKTAVGYGRMEKNDSELTRLEALRQQEREKQAAERHRAQQSPLERKMDEVIQRPVYNGLTPYKALIQAMEKGEWQGDEKRQVAAHIKSLMQQEKGQWKETSGAKKPEKDNEYQRTLKVMKWLNEA